MRQIVNTGLPEGKSPVELAGIANGTLYVCSIPSLADGSIEAGGIEAQTEQTLRNLMQSVEAAGATMDDVFQVQVFLTDHKHFQGMNSVYAKFFNKPYPVRATFIAGLIVPGADIEILAQADVSELRR
ncbi:RidA family protein [Phyllobacterium endophyticum]|uniref:Reactive intermediate/imine deaminase n=1 Tax=Phyllobacterium endophyticum TaxID=1149773 RepID=A0A2P7AKB8_9HYPH|nr:RidA family protein [Phyllobacterium endophyticum]MBB3237123.1 enamine deaminase RidA (YjgF/YER057c/UK114 family) [Phyllobacterium endophyticum]PSH54649.1 reactive intermediate/imine deaminase [Phyllobacterium endophyticum]TYR40583.1 RidA family protein [Phyllobacterium endophyticum]